MKTQPGKSAGRKTKQKKPLKVSRARKKTLKNIGKQNSPSSKVGSEKKSALKEIAKLLDIPLSSTSKSSDEAPKVSKSKLLLKGGSKRDASAEKIEVKKSSCKGSARKLPTKAKGVAVKYEKPKKPSHVRRLSFTLNQDEKPTEKKKPGRPKGSKNKKLSLRSKNEMAKKKQKQLSESAKKKMQKEVKAKPSVVEAVGTAQRKKGNPFYIEMEFSSPSNMSEDDDGDDWGAEYFKNKGSRTTFLARSKKREISKQKRKKEEEKPKKEPAKSLKKSSKFVKSEKPKKISVVTRFPDYDDDDSAKESDSEGEKSNHKNKKTTKKRLKAAAPVRKRTARMASLNAIAMMHCMNEDARVPFHSTSPPITEMALVLRVPPKPVSSDDEEEPEERPSLKMEMDKGKKQRRKRRGELDVKMDMKDMVVTKRMASLNASAIMAACCSLESRRRPSAPSESTESEVTNIKRKISYKSTKGADRKTQSVITVQETTKKVKKAEGSRETEVEERIIVKKKVKRQSSVEQEHSNATDTSEAETELISKSPSPEKMIMESSITYITTQTPTSPLSVTVSGVSTYCISSGDGKTTVVHKVQHKSKTTSNGFVSSALPTAYIPPLHVQPTSSSNKRGPNYSPLGALSVMTPSANQGARPPHIPSHNPPPRPPHPHVHYDQRQPFPSHAHRPIYSPYPFPQRPPPPRAHVAPILTPVSPHPYSHTVVSSPHSSPKQNSSVVCHVVSPSLRSPEVMDGVEVSSERHHSAFSAPAAHLPSNSCHSGYQPVTGPVPVNTAFTSTSTVSPYRPPKESPSSSSPVKRISPPIPPKPYNSVGDSYHPPPYPFQSYSYVQSAPPPPYEKYYPKPSYMYNSPYPGGHYVQGGHHEYPPYPPSGPVHYSQDGYTSYTLCVPAQPQSAQHLALPSPPSSTAPSHPPAYATYHYTEYTPVFPYPPGPPPPPPQSAMCCPADPKNLHTGPLTGDCKGSDYSKGMNNYQYFVGNNESNECSADNLVTPVSTSSFVSDENLRGSLRCSGGDVPPQPVCSVSEACPPVPPNTAPSALVSNAADSDAALQKDSVHLFNTSSACYSYNLQASVVTSHADFCQQPIVSTALNNRGTMSLGYNSNVSEVSSLPTSCPCSISSCNEFCADKLTFTSAGSEKSNTVCNSVVNETFKGITVDISKTKCKKSEVTDSASTVSEKMVGPTTWTVVSSASVKVPKELHSNITSDNKVAGSNDNSSADAGAITISESDAQDRSSLDSKSSSCDDSDTLSDCRKDSDGHITPRPGGRHLLCQSVPIHAQGKSSSPIKARPKHLFLKGVSQQLSLKNSTNVHNKPEENFSLLTSKENLVDTGSDISNTRNTSANDLPRKRGRPPKKKLSTEENGSLNCIEKNCANEEQKKAGNHQRHRMSLLSCKKSPETLDTDVKNTTSSSPVCNSSKPVVKLEAQVKCEKNSTKVSSSKVMPRLTALERVNHWREDVCKMKSDIAGGFNDCKSAKESIIALDLKHRNNAYFLCNKDLPCKKSGSYCSSEASGKSASSLKDNKNCDLIGKKPPLKGLQIRKKRKRSPPLAKVRKKASLLAYLKERNNESDNSSIDVEAPLPPPLPSYQQGRKRNKSSGSFKPFPNHFSLRKRHSSGQGKAKNRKPKWVHGWHWEGKSFEGKIWLRVSRKCMALLRSLNFIHFFKNDELPVMRKCYECMRHKEGDNIRVRDCVLLRSGPKKTDLPYVAKIAALWEDPETSDMMMSILWYYRPEHTESGRRKEDLQDEIFASRHRDHLSVACIEDKCFVLTFNEYCRYQRLLTLIQEGDFVPAMSPVPDIEDGYDRKERQPPSCVVPELLFLCRKVYDYRQKRLLKNPY